MQGRNSDKDEDGHCMVRKRAHVFTFLDEVFGRVVHEMGNVE